MLLDTQCGEHWRAMYTVQSEPQPLSGVLKILLVQATALSQWPRLLVWLVAARFLQNQNTNQHMKQLDQTSELKYHWGITRMRAHDNTTNIMSEA